MIDAVDENTPAKMLTLEISRVVESGFNTLGLILRKLDLTRESRVLDIGGAAYNGQESTRFIVEQFSSQIDVTRPKTRDVDEFLKSYGARVTLLDNLPPAHGAPYDLVVLAPNLIRTFADLRHFAVTRSQLVRTGGYLIAHGLRPESVGSEAFLAAPDEVVEEFKFSFDFIDLYSAILPPYLSSFRWIGQFPRKARSRSFLAWYVFQKVAAPAAGSIAIPAGSNNQRAAGASPFASATTEIRSQPGARPVLVAPARTPAAKKKSSSSFPRSDADNEAVATMVDMLRRVERFGPTEYERIFDDIALIPPTPEVIEALAGARFDTVMFVNNTFELDARVMKTADAVHGFGRCLLAVGLNRGPSYEVRHAGSGFRLILIPNHNSEISKALKKNGFPLDVGPRYEIWMAVASVYLATLLIGIRDKPPSIVVHSHDFMGAYAGGNAVKHAGASTAMSGTSLKWIHDVHEFVQRYDIIDPTLQKIGCLWEETLYPYADGLSTVSGTLADNLIQYYRLRSQPLIIYNSNRLSARHKYKGPSCREFVGCEGAPLLVHSGSIRPGRGVEYAIEALKEVVDAHLLLLTGSDTPYLATLLERAEQWDVRPRVHIHPLLPYDQVAGFIADATAGLIPMEHYGNADVALPNKLFDYINAEVPVISADTENIKTLMTEWKIGKLFPAKDVGALVKAIRNVVDNQGAFRASIRARPDLALSFAWEVQVMKLFDMYKRLEVHAHTSYTMTLPQY